MEPRDGSEMKQMVIIVLMPSGHNKQFTNFISSLRLRGGMMNPNVDPKYNEIPALSVRKFIYDGLPKVDFNELVLYPLNAGLGSISMNGATLLATVRRSDP